jgi:hypothetical protein
LSIAQVPGEESQNGGGNQGAENHADQGAGHAERDAFANQGPPQAALRHTKRPQQRQGAAAAQNRQGLG